MRRILLIVPLVLAACGDPAATVTDGALTVTADAPTLRLTNGGEQAIYWSAVEAGTAARIDWFPCADPDHCDHLDPGESRSVPYEEIYGYSPGARDALVYWWALAPSGNSYAVISLRTMHVRL